MAFYRRLRQRLSQLVVGPVNIDFGYNLMQFNPFVRWRLDYWPFDEVIVICREKEKYIWEDIATDFHFIKNESYSTYRWLNQSKNLIIPYKLRRRLGVRERFSGNSVCIPNKETCTQNKRRLFIPLGEDNYDLEYDIVFHARGTVKNGSRYRNWDIRNYGEFIDRLGKDYRMCSVGVEAYHVPGTDDMREVPLDQLCNIIRSSKMVVGPACGFMGLANLCQTSVLMWTDDEIKEKFGRTNTARFRHRWKPFPMTPNRIVEKYGWNPSPQKIVKEFFECQQKFQE